MLFHKRLFGGLYYLTWYAVSFNEGGKYFNFHFRIKNPMGFYIYFLKRRIYWFSS